MADNLRRHGHRLLVGCALSGLLIGALAGCAGTTGTLGAQVSRAETQPPQSPADAPPGTCWSTHTSPAVIETVTVQVMTHPARVAPDGTIERPARFRRETRQSIVEERRESWFETPCPDQMSPYFIGSLQRALAERGLYDGQITATMDAPTRAAVRRFQELDGFANDELSLLSARKLGLIAVEL